MLEKILQFLDIDRGILGVIERAGETDTFPKRATSFFLFNHVSIYFPVKIWLLTTLTVRKKELAITYRAIVRKKRAIRGILLFQLFVRQYHIRIDGGVIVSVGGKVGTWIFEAIAPYGGMRLPDYDPCPFPDLLLWIFLLHISLPCICLSCFLHFYILPTITFTYSPPFFVLSYFISFWYN